jgi:hypothetical protein
MPGPMLAQTQQLLWTLITAPEGAAAGVAALAPADRSFAESLLRAGGRLSPMDRLDIYADMYFYRLRDCLQEDFAAVRAVIGGAAFHNLITDYLLAHPPTHFSLRQAGRNLPAFLDTYAGTAPWPFLGELAALEWAVLDAFDAPDVPPLEITALQALPADQWPELRFDLGPSLQRLHVDWRVDAVLQGVQSGAAPAVRAAAPLAAPTWLRIWRQDLRVFHRPIDAAEAAALDAVLKRESFATVCAAVGELIGEAAGAERMVQILDTWFADGLVTGCGGAAASRSIYEAAASRLTATARASE